ncbi:polyprenyl synthetase family protein [Microterricola pindariensis]|uniref:Geranylgeranyl pyrophosphate synthase n=1 Tax=Microterricola pindariensis TaxID=478010 RepID=A0ABX5AUN9_9MICO|nr:polyprenyl synthetase family protein [Microterricola pindariensis]PPL18612.1 geranylgeranyl pyrophosphate synthase [Microterricola pindariensis]
MAESTRLVDLVDSRISEFLADRAPIVRAISPELNPFVEFSRQFLSGGKRFRALFCYWGFESVTGSDSGFDPFADDEEPARDLRAIVSVAAALEIFHAAALVHDDIIDNSDTRRGSASAHRLFEALHADSEWAGNPAAFGRAAAILLGDLLLGWSDELLDEGLELLEDRAAARATRAAFNHMRTEVTAGQYLDVLEESAWLRRPDDELRERAERVIVYKSAKYSVQAPLLIGATLAGGTPAQLAALRDFGLPLGVAYQLRDDLLGVFGDAAVTGKPSGDDLREGKRTVLVAIARGLMPQGARRAIDELLGDAELDETQVRMLQNTIIDCGAVDEVEALISRNVRTAIAAIGPSPLSRRAIAQLSELAETVTKRSA